MAVSITDTETEPEATSKQHWIAAFCAVGALTVMVVAFVLTQRQGFCLRRGPVLHRP